MAWPSNIHSNTGITIINPPMIIQNILCIDPGVKQVAWAYSEEQTNGAGHRIEEVGITAAVEWGEELLHEKDPFKLGQAVAFKLTQSLPGIDKVVVERPQMYVGSKNKGNPNDLLDLAIVVGCLSTITGGEVVSVLPATWKGQVPKPTHHARIGEFLTGEGSGLRSSHQEFEMWKRISKLKKHHNERDAVALCLWATGRVGRGGEKL